MRLLTNNGSASYLPLISHHCHTHANPGHGVLLALHATSRMCWSWFWCRVYKNYDPRATIIKKVAEDVFAIAGRDPLIDIAVELEKIARSDDYFISRKLYPNVDFYSGQFISKQRARSLFCLYLRCCFSSGAPPSSYCRSWM